MSLRRLNDNASSILVGVRTVRNVQNYHAHCASGSSVEQSRISRSVLYTIVEWLIHPYLDEAHETSSSLCTTRPD